MQDRLAAVEDEAERLSGVLSGMVRELEANPPATVEESDRRAEAAQRLADTLVRYEQELAKMRKDAEARDRQQKEIRVRAARTKQEYDQLKTVYDEEFKRDQQTLQDHARQHRKGGRQARSGAAFPLPRHQTALHAADGEIGGWPVRRVLHVAALGHAARTQARRKDRGVRQLRPHTLRPQVKALS